MLKKIKTINKSELLIFLTWIKGENVLNNKTFKYDYLLLECMDENSDNEINVDGILDDLMMDSFQIYDKLKKTSKEEFLEKFKNSMFNVVSKEMISESMRSMETFVNLYENILTNTKFEYPEIRGIQKNILTEMINVFISNEEYEKCIEFKEKIKEI